MVLGYCVVRVVKGQKRFYRWSDCYVRSGVISVTSSATLADRRFVFADEALAKRVATIAGGGVRPVCLAKAVA